MSLSKFIRARTDDASPKRERRKEARPGELLAGVPDHPVFKVFWDVASADSFAPPATTLSLRGSKQRWR